MTLWCGIVCCILFLLPASLARALDVPELTGRVVDQAGLLDETQRAALENKLAEHERGTSHQIAVLTIPSLDGEPIEDFSMQVVEHWKLGQKKEDNGVLLLVARDDHKVRIEVGYGLEGDIPDALAGRIISNVMVPRFRQNDFAGGIAQAVDLLIQASSGNKVAVPDAPGGAAPFGVGNLIFLIVLALIVGPQVLLWLGLFGRRRGGFFGGGFGSGFGGGFSSGGFSSGGFSSGGFSGGGGSFGGGGASGSW